MSKKYVNKLKSEAGMNYIEIWNTSNAKVVIPNFKHL